MVPVNHTSTSPGWAPSLNRHRSISGLDRSNGSFWLAAPPSSVILISRLIIPPSTFFSLQPIQSFFRSQVSTTNVHHSFSHTTSICDRRRTILKLSNLFPEVTASLPVRDSNLCYCLYDAQRTTIIKSKPIQASTTIPFTITTTRSALDQQHSQRSTNLTEL